MTARRLNKILNVICPILSLLIIAGVWALLYAKIGSEYLFPSIKATFSRVWEYVCGKNLWIALSGTMARTLLSFCLSLIVALALGVFAHLWSPVGKIFAPIIAIMRSAPTVAIMVILAFIVTPKQSPIIVSVTVVLPMLYASTRSALNQIPKGLIEMSRVYEVPLRKRIFGLYVPSVAPTLIGEAGASLSFNVKLTVSAEILAYTARSLGGMIQESNVYADMSGLFALTIISVLIASLLELLVKLVVFLLKKGGAV